MELGLLSIDGIHADGVKLQAEDVNAGIWKNEKAFSSIEAADGIILGSPTFTGSVSAVMKAFMETCFHPWTGQKWKDKFASGFTNSASQSGDKLIP